MFVYSSPFINYSRFRLATILYFAIIVFDEVRPKVFLYSREIDHCLSCLLSKNSKNVLFCKIMMTMISFEKIGSRVPHVATTAN